MSWPYIWHPDRILARMLHPVMVSGTRRFTSSEQGRREGGAGGALCPRASGSKGPRNWRNLTFGLQEML